MFHGTTGSLPLQEVSDVKEDGSDPLLVTLLASKRELKLQFLNDAIKDQFVATIRSYCNLSWTVCLKHSHPKTICFGIEHAPAFSPTSSGSWP